MWTRLYRYRGAMLRPLRDFICTRTRQFRRPLRPYRVAATRAVAPYHLVSYCSIRSVHQPLTPFEHRVARSLPQAICNVQTMNLTVTTETRRTEVGERATRNATGSEFRTERSRRRLRSAALPRVRIRLSHPRHDHTVGRPRRSLCAGGRMEGRGAWLAFRPLIHWRNHPCERNRMSS